MKLTEKNLNRMISLTKPNTYKRMYYSLLYLGSYGYCLKCQKRHSGVCNEK